MSTNNFCEECGNKLNKEIKFCPNCGAKVNRDISLPNEIGEVDNTLSNPDILCTEEKKEDIIATRSIVIATKETDTLQGKFLSFQGRLNRLVYFTRSLILAGSAMFMYILASILMEMVNSLDGMIIIGALMLILSIPLCISGISLQVRRCHDLGKSGWLTLVIILPIINFAYMLYLLLANGHEGDNAYGADPLRR